MNELIYAILGQMSMPIAQRNFLQLFFPTLLFLRSKFNFRTLSRYVDFSLLNEEKSFFSRRKDS